MARLEAWEFVYISVYQFIRKLLRSLWSGPTLSLALVVSNGLVGLFTNLGSTPIWAMVVLLICTICSVVFSVIKVFRGVTKAKAKCMPTGFGGIRWIFYTTRRDDKRIPYFGWGTIIFEGLIHISYISCAIFIIILVTKKSASAKIIGLDFTTWVLVNTGVSVILSCVETYKMVNKKLYVRNNEGGMDLIQENKSIPTFNQEKIYDRVDNQTKPLVIVVQSN